MRNKALLSALFCLMVITGCSTESNEPKKPTSDPSTSTVDTLAFTVNGATFTMIKVDGGTYAMGAADTDIDADEYERPSHQVKLSTYYIGRFEVTQSLWQAVMGSNPSTYKNGSNPVETVCVSECLDFIQRLNTLTGKTFTLPTEAQWEYAARGGKQSKGYKYAGSNDVDSVAWYNTNAVRTTHPVGMKKPNELGIYDMSGNVWEWCQDYYYIYPDVTQTDPVGATTGARQMNRGGAFELTAWDCRITRRNADAPNHHHDIFGFRLVLIP